LPGEQDPAFLTIEGVIGVGKSTLARMLGERLEARVVEEEVEENPFLEPFYRDRRRYAFSCQIFFLLSRYRQQRALRQPDLFQSRIVCDYLFRKDRIFATLNLDEDEMVLYDQILPLLERELPRPDRVVYLQASLETLLRRIERRGRPFEKDMDPDYLRALSEAYNHFFFHYEEAPLLVVNTDAIDFVENPEDLEDLTRRIRQHVSGTLYYTPLGSRK
jgi:deoxyadenosine/deoxycytidine kinase